MGRPRSTTTRFILYKTTLNDQWVLVQEFPKMEDLSVYTGYSRCVMSQRYNNKSNTRNFDTFKRFYSIVGKQFMPEIKQTLSSDEMTEILNRQNYEITNKKKEKQCV
jgi:hypothetical protein